MGGEQSPRSLSQHFFTAMMLLLSGVVALWVALDILARIWGWLVLGGLVALGVIVAIKWLRWRRERW
jgi:hypothetical protein